MKIHSICDCYTVFAGETTVMVTVYVSVLTVCVCVYSVIGTSRAKQICLGTDVPSCWTGIWFQDVMEGFVLLIYRRLMWNGCYWVVRGSRNPLFYHGFWSVRIISIVPWKDVRKVILVPNEPDCH